MKTLLNNSALVRVWDRYRRAKDGVAAVEFALVAPIMIFLYLGIAEISMLVTADRNVSHATSVTADLLTQIQSIETDDMENILDAAVAVLEINSSEMSKISMDMISLSKDSSGNFTEEGYMKLGTGYSQKYAYQNLSDTLINDKSGLVIARLQYTFTTPTNKYVKSPNLDEVFMLKPRQSATIPFGTGGKIFTCSLGATNGKLSTACTSN